MRFVGRQKDLTPPMVKTTLRQLAEYDPDDQFLGEFETEVIVSSPLSVLSGGNVHFELEPDDSQAPHAIRVENGNLDLIGHLPPGLADWLQPLMQKGRIRLEGYVPMGAAEASYVSPTQITIVVMVFQASGGNLLAPIEPADESEALHEMVRHAYCSAQSYQKPEMVLGLAQRLSALKWQKLLPQTRLLLALLPGLVHEVQAANGLTSIVLFRELLDTLSVGEPMHYENLTLFPLFWPESRRPPYVSLTAAVASGAAIIEEVAGNGAEETGLVVSNRGTEPLLICEGEIVFAQRQEGIVAKTAVLKQGAVIPLTLTPIWLWRSSHFDGGEKGSTAGSVDSGPDAGPKRLSDPTSVRMDRDASSGQRSTFPLCPLAAGVVAAWSGQVRAIDLFASEETLKAVWQSMIDACFVAAMHGGQSGGLVSPADARQFIEQLAGAARAGNLPSVLDGELEIDNETLAGRALLYEGHICHLWAINK